MGWERTQNLTDGAYEGATQSIDTGERNPTNFVVITPEYLVNDITVSADPGTSYAPGANGIQMLGYKDIVFQLYLKGGTYTGGYPAIVTVQFEAYNGLDVSSTAQWIDITKAGYDLTTNTMGNAEYQSSGTDVEEFLIDFDNLNCQAIRVVYDWDNAPNDTDGAIVITARRKAL